MRRWWLVCGLLTLCAVQVGCAGTNWCGGGCGEKYWGPYVNDPPRCEPCDCYGNFTGGGCGTGCGDGCSSYTSDCDTGCGSRYPWIRSRDRRASFIQMLGCCDLFGCFKSSCTDGCCEPTCGEPACGEPACGEPACGEPACGAPTCEPACGEPGCGVSSAPSCGCGESHASGFNVPSYATRSPRRSVPVQTVSRSTNVDYRMPSAAGGCNCGKH